MPSTESRSSIMNAATNEPIAASWEAKLKSRAFAEVAVGYGLVLIAVWSPDPLQRYLFWITLLWIVAATLISRPDASTLGLRPSAMRRSLWVAGVAAIAAVIAVWLAWELHTLHSFFHPMPSGARFWQYLAWAFLQQFMLQDYFLLRLLRLFPSRTAAVWAAAVLFATVHLPNPLLLVVTLLWGAAACTLFLRYRDLCSLALAHAILGMCLAITVPNAVHHHMRVGLGYFRYRAQTQPAHPSQIDQMVSTEAWVMAEATSRRSSRHALP